MANGRRALSRSASLGSFGKSPACQSGVMWISELARNTITAESRIGSHSDSRLIMEAPLYSYGYGAGWNFTQRLPLWPNAPPLGLLRQRSSRRSRTPDRARGDPLGRGIPPGHEVSASC